LGARPGARARPLLANDVREPDGAVRRIPGAWNDSVPRAALEAHFGRGLLAIANRLPNFARVYDTAERILPREHHARKVDGHEAQRELLRLAGRAMGIAAAADLADYYRMPIGEARPRLAELVEAGDLRKVQVEGWERAGLSRSRGARAAVDRRREPALPLRSGGLVSPPRGAPLSIRIPHRDLRAAAAAPLGLLRASFSVGRAPGGARGSEGRSERRTGCACSPPTWSLAPIPARWRRRWPVNWRFGRDGWTWIR
jgi:hypothetical protein